MVAFKMKISAMNNRLLWHIIAQMIFIWDWLGEVSQLHVRCRAQLNTYPIWRSPCATCWWWPSHTSKLNITSSPSTSHNNCSQNMVSRALHYRWGRGNKKQTRTYTKKRRETTKNTWIWQNMTWILIHEMSHWLNVGLLLWCRCNMRKRRSTYSQTHTHTQPMKTYTRTTQRQADRKSQNGNHRNNIISYASIFTTIFLHLFFAHFHILIYRDFYVHVCVFLNPKKYYISLRS